jgi:hypothetical protein
MRASAIRLLSCFVAILVVVASPTPGLAQEEPEAELRLLAQTAWTTPEEPSLDLTVRIENVGELTISDPRLRWELGPKVGARFEYETALEEGPSFAAAADTETLPADLAPGASTEVTIAIDTGETGGIDATDSGVYPLELELRSEDASVASITTAAIHVARPPEQRVLFSWWTEIATPVAFGPDGTMIDAGFGGALASGGSLVAQVEAISHLLRTQADVAIDLVVSPAALDQLRMAADGYVDAGGDEVGADSPGPTAAADTLDRLVAIVEDPRVRLHAMPFAAPRLPALLSGGLATHLQAQWQTGDELVEQVLGEGPDVAVARPPGVAFDQRSVEHLVLLRGTTTILGAADSVVRPPQTNDYAPPPAATLTTSFGQEVELLLPDPATQSLLEDSNLLEDPIRAAQVVLGELATIWREQPVPGEEIERGLALDLSTGLPAGFWLPALRRLARAPFLQATHAGDLADLIEPSPDPAELLPYDEPGFTEGYADDLEATGRRLAAFASVLEEPVDEADRHRRDLLYAEASQYVENEGSGRVWIESVNDAMDRIFARIAPDTSRVLTYTSSGRIGIPLRMGDPGDRVLNVRVQLASGRVAFLEDDVQAVTLDRPDQVLTFAAEVKAAGPSSIEVFVIAPNGEVLSRQVLVVRSTAINSIALIITIGAGLILVGLWSRRLFRRRSP